MGGLQLFRTKTVADLYGHVAENLSVYREGSFDYLLADPSIFIESSCTVDDSKLNAITCREGDDNEVECCLAILGGLKGVTAYLARDERLWTRLTHIELLKYSRQRWPIPSDDEKAVAHIRRHFFAKGARGIERDNSASRLWWMANICAKVEGLSLKDALETFLYQSDVRANIVERPTTSQNAKLLSAVILKLNESYKTEEKALYERSRFRSVMKKLNIEGGVRLLEVLDDSELAAVVERASS